MTNLSFKVLRAANLARVVEFRDAKGRLSHPLGVSNWSHSTWFMAMIGEAGELGNLLKKVFRGDFTQEEVQSQIADELADIQTYLDLLAESLEVDLGDATIRKFNRISERVGSNVMIHLDGETWSHK